MHLPKLEDCVEGLPSHLLARRLNPVFFAPCRGDRVAFFCKNEKFEAIFNIYLKGLKV
jgi:hypothetical protein